MSHAEARQHRRRWSRPGWRLSLLALTLPLSVLFGLGAGSAEISPWALLERAFVDGDATARAILWMARLPRVVMGAIVGAGLSLSGVCFQALLKNPLADPYVLGISGGAALGATLWLALGLGAALLWGPWLGAILGAGFSLLLLWMIQRGGGAGLDPLALLLSGVIFNAFASALITFIKAVVSATKAQELLFYLMGSLSVEGLGWLSIGISAAVVFAGLAAILPKWRALDVLSLGDEEALALGVEVEGLRRWVVGWASLVVAVCVAFTGLIGFVGLVIPHGLRLALGPGHRILLPASALFGAAFVVVCDGVARQSFSLFSTTLPVGVITATIGAPLFVLLLMRSLREQADV